MLDNGSIETKTKSETKEFVEQTTSKQADISGKLKARNQVDVLQNDLITFVRKKTKDIIDSSWFKTMCFSIKLLDAQCGPVGSKKSQIGKKEAIEETLKTIYNTNLSCENTYVAQIQQSLLTLQKHADSLLEDYTIKCGIQQFSIDINLHIQFTALKSNAVSYVPNTHSTYNVFVEFLTNDRIQIEIPQFSKLYQISIINYQAIIKPQLKAGISSLQIEYNEELYVYPLTKEKVKELASVLLKMELISIEAETPCYVLEAFQDTHAHQKMIGCINPQLYPLNLRSVSMYNITQINSFCSRITEAMQNFKTPAETFFPATQWNHRILGLKKNLSRLQTTIMEMMRQAPADQKERDEKITYANRQLQTQIFEVWLDIALDYGLKKDETYYMAMFDLVREWKLGLSDDYFTLHVSLLEMTARCERAEASNAELIGQIKQAGETKGRFIEKSKQIVELNAKVTQAQEDAASVKVECQLFAKSIVTILHTRELTDKQIVEKLKVFIGSQAPALSQNVEQAITHKKKKNDDNHEKKADYSESEDEDFVQDVQDVQERQSLSSERSTTSTPPAFVSQYKATVSRSQTPILIQEASNERPNQSHSDTTAKTDP